MSRFLLNHGILFIAGLGHGTFVAGVIASSRECLGFYSIMVFCLFAGLGHGTFVSGVIASSKECLGFA